MSQMLRDLLRAHAILDAARTYTQREQRHTINNLLQSLAINLFEIEPLVQPHDPEILSDLRLAVRHIREAQQVPLPTWEPTVTRQTLAPLTVLHNTIARWTCEHELDPELHTVTLELFGGEPTFELLLHHLHAALSRPQCVLADAHPTHMELTFMQTQTSVERGPESSFHLCELLVTAHRGQLHLDNDATATTLRVSLPLKP